MRQHSLCAGIVIRFVIVVLVVISLVSIVSNLLIRHQFEQYIMQQQETQANELAQNLNYQYDTCSGQWNLDYVHGMGMYALDEGYIMKLYDAEGNSLWDAENHDMTLCHEIMNSITLKMQEKNPDSEGEFVTRRFDLKQDEKIVGYLDISYYSPYYLDENGFQFLESLNRILIAVGIVSVLGAVLMGIFLAGNISRPITKTADLAKRISEGDYSTRFEGDIRTRELCELASSVNRMAENLEQQEKLRKRLTSDIAHELRTPIANISSYLEMMNEGVWEPTPERLQSCYEELQRISGLVSDLERLRQLEDENLKLEKTDVDLLELSQSVAKQFEKELLEKNQTCTVKGDPAMVSADKDRLRQVIMNLISNAIKYTPEGGTILVETEASEDKGILRVKDNGIGISEEDCGRIFERFYRADKSRNRKTGGAGIGLAIAKSIVRAHGGKISVTSKEGEGSCFTVELQGKKYY